MTNKITLEETFEANKDIVFDLLGGVGVKSFIVTFSGGGDDGQVEGVSEIEPKSKKVLESANALLDESVSGSKISGGERWHPNGITEILWKSDPTLREMIDSLCYDSLAKKHGGWEINDGSEGTFYFDVEERKLTLDFNERVMGFNNYEYDL